MIISDRVKFVAVTLLIGVVLSVACFTDRISGVLVALIVLSNLGFGISQKIKD